MPGVNLKNLDLNLLVVFEAIYSTGNISRAAVQLSMSQPAVSNALARLRSLIDDPLFVRAKRGVEPTSKAREMIGAVREALDLIKRQLDGTHLDLAAYRRQFRILMPDFLEPIMMPPLLKLITEQAPGVSIESPPVFRMDFANELLSGTLDLACYIYPVNAPDIVTVPICPVDVVIIARRQHPRIGATLDIETFQSLKQVTLIPELRALTHVEKDMAASRVQRHVVYMVGKLWSVPPIVERSDLVGTVPRRFAEEISKNFDIAIYDPPVPIAEQHLYMMWHRKNEHDPGHRWLRETLLIAVPQEVAAADNVTPFVRRKTTSRPTRPRPE
jgi:DNA-binding transcriptional LysR family regulator